APFGDCNGDGGAAGAGAGITVGAALRAARGPALDGGTAMGCAADAAAGSTFCFPAALSPETAVGTASLGKLGPVLGAALGTGVTGGIGPVVAVGGGSALPKGCQDPGCADPLCGCTALGLFCGGVVGSAGLCHDAGASPAGRLS